MRFFGFVLLLALAPATWIQAQPDALSSGLEAIRVKYKLPALAGAIFTSEGLQEQRVVGIRKAGTSIAATSEDQWHLGSDTKAMTATLVGSFVNEGKLTWNAKVISFFPEFAKKIPAGIRDITIGQVLSHHAGLKGDLPWDTFAKKGTLPEQRLAATELALETPAYPAGAFHYANTDYVVIGAILDRVGGKPWEALMQKRLFDPLHMSSAGFGGVGTPGLIDQPWGHDATGQPAPSNGRAMDLPPILESAGGVHASLSDWTRFLADQLRGAEGRPALLPAPIYRSLQTPVDLSGAAYGWGAFPQPWSAAKVLTHAGTNGMFYCLCLLAPANDFGVAVCTNQGGDAAGEACNEAVTLLVEQHLAASQGKTSPSAH
jgi:D-alanyl-D-alanine carboxypeptidase